MREMRIIPNLNQINRQKVRHLIKPQFFTDSELEVIFMIDIFLTIF
jgi:hypothetical protein